MGAWVGPIPVAGGLPAWGVLAFLQSAFIWSSQQPCEGTPSVSAGASSGLHSWSVIKVRTHAGTYDSPLQALWPPVSLQHCQAEIAGLHAPVGGWHEASRL